AAFRQGSCRRKSRITRADHRDVHALRQRSRSIALGQLDGGEPVSAFLNSHMGSRFLVLLLVPFWGRLWLLLLRYLFDCRPTHKTAVSSISLPAAKRDSPNNDVSTRSHLPVRINSPRIFPVEGACITPCPLNPLARKNPGTPSTGPRMG